MFLIRFLFSLALIVLFLCMAILVLAPVTNAVLEDFHKRTTATSTATSTLTTTPTPTPQEPQHGR